jgi:hypothetical protein
VPVIVMSTRDPTRNATVIVSTFKIKKKKDKLDTAKAVLRGMFIATSAYMKKQRPLK